MTEKKMTSLWLSAENKRRLTDFGDGSMAKGIREMIRVLDVLHTIRDEMPGVTLDRALRIAIGEESR